MKNYPCHQIGITIERDLPGHGKSLKKHAKGWGGVFAWVERLGQPTLGDKMCRHNHKWRAWQPNGQA